MANRLHVFGFCLVAAGCSGSEGRSSAPILEARADLEGEPFDQVLLRVKQEVGLFQSKSDAWHTGLRRDFARLGITPQCGTGDINFLIRTVRMQFATVLGRTVNGEIGLKIPFGPAGTGNVGPEVKGSFGLSGTSTLEYTYYVPDPLGRLDPVAAQNIAANAVIAPTLAALRDGLVRATAQLPCMRDTPEDKDNTFAFSVELARDANPKVGFNFLIVSASAGVETSNKRSNTITVTFHPTPTGGAMLF